MDPTEIPIRDLHLPDAIGWWPLAPGWWFVIGLVLVGLVLLLRQFLRRRAQGAARRLALRQLDRCAAEYAAHGNPVKLGAEVSTLLRRTMLAYAPRSDVAALTGDDWLEWLDRDLEEARFTRGAGRRLVELPYRNPAWADDDVDIDGMLAAVRERLRTPVGGLA